MSRYSDAQSVGHTHSAPGLTEIKPVDASTAHMVRKTHPTIASAQLAKQSFAKNTFPSRSLGTIDKTVSD